MITGTSKPINTEVETVVPCQQDVQMLSIQPLVSIKLCPPLTVCVIDRRELSHKVTHDSKAHIFDNSPACGRNACCRIKPGSRYSERRYQAGVPGMTFLMSLIECYDYTNATPGPLKHQTDSYSSVAPPLLMDFLQR